MSHEDDLKGRLTQKKKISQEDNQTKRQQEHNPKERQHELTGRTSQGDDITKISQKKTNSQKDKIKGSQLHRKLKTISEKEHRAGRLLDKAIW